MTADSASFRDPAGQVVLAEGKPLRLVDVSYREHFDYFLSSGLYAELVRQKLIVGFDDVTDARRDAAWGRPYKILSPEYIDFISYPYEWCFSQLRDAALLTLAIQKTALSHGMVLKDATAYNIQFQSGWPVHIDTLSFERYREGTPWQAYRQFCQHFLSPLALMALRDPSAAKLSGCFPDGIPLAAASRLLGNAWLRRPSLFMHIKLHARLESRPATGKAATSSRAIGQASLRHMAEHLEKLVRSLPAPTIATHWDRYGQELPYTREEAEAKRAAVREYCERLRPATVWDLGANSGEFSAIAAATGAKTIAIENDHALVEKMYAGRRTGMALSPLWMDLLNPSPMSGWADAEHLSLAARGPADLVLCLAVSHHLALAGQVPFDRQADYFSRLGKHVLMEYVSDEDPKTAAMLERQPALKSRYSREEFDRAFAARFDLADSRVIVPGKRTLMLFKSRHV